MHFHIIITVLFLLKNVVKGHVTRKSDFWKVITHCNKKNVKTEDTDEPIQS